jgi:hypothetical protein
MPILTGPKRGPDGGLNTDVGEVEAMERYSYAPRIDEILESYGVTAPPRPMLDEEHQQWIPGLVAGQYFNGRLPTIIRKMTLDQLSVLHSLFSGYFAYLAFVTNKAAAERSESLRKKEFLWSYIRDSIKRALDPETGKRPTDQSASDATRHDIRFVTASADYDVKNCVYETLTGMLKIAEQDMRVISREITIQQMKLFEGYKGSNPMMEAARRAGRAAFVEDVHADMAEECARDFNPGRPAPRGAYHPSGAEPEGGTRPPPAGRTPITRRR